MNNVYETALIVLLRLFPKLILSVLPRNRILLVQIARSLQPAQSSNTQCYVITAVIVSLYFKSQKVTKDIIMTLNSFLYHIW